MFDAFATSGEPGSASHGNLRLPQPQVGHVGSRCRFVKPIYISCLWLMGLVDLPHNSWIKTEHHQILG